MTTPTGTGLVGVVVGFDAEVGLGEIESSGVTYPFHCVEIADGTRRIEVGTEVRFDVRPKLGRWEAADLRP